MMCASFQPLSEADWKIVGTNAKAGRLATRNPPRAESVLGVGTVGPQSEGRAPKVPEPGPAGPGLGLPARDLLVRLRHVHFGPEAPHIQAAQGRLRQTSVGGTTFRQRGHVPIPRTTITRASPELAPRAYPKMAQRRDLVAIAGLGLAARPRDLTKSGPIARTRPESCQRTLQFGQHRSNLPATTKSGSAMSTRAGGTDSRFRLGFGDGCIHTHPRVSCATCCRLLVFGPRDRRNKSG